MRLDPIIDSLYFLSTLWGGTGSQVCVATPQGASEIPLEAAQVSSRVGRAAAMAFVDVNVVPMDAERVLANHTVVVEGGRITALGPSGEVKVPAGAVRINGRGKYLMPGLGDMHVHSVSGYGAPEPTFTSTKDKWISWTAMGVTSLRTLAEGGTDASVEHMQRLREDFAKGEWPHPRLYIARGFPKKSTPLDSLNSYVAAAKAAGYDHIGLPYFQVRAPDDRVFFDTLLAATRRAGLPLSAHSHGLPLDVLLALGSVGGAVDHVASLVYALGYEVPSGYPGPGKPPLVPVDVPMKKIQELAGAMRRAGIWFVPTLACETTVKNVPIKGIPQIVKTLHDSGVKLLLAGDEADVRLDLAALVQAGLTPYQALLTGTRNVAEYMRRLDDLGTVAVGKRADLVLLYGNPLANIGHMWEPAGVMTEGRWLDRAALDRGLYLSKKMPWYWIVQEVRSLSGLRTMHRLTPEQGEQFSVHMKKIFSLDDSLEVAGPETHQRTLQKLAEEFAAIRRFLKPEQQMVFDPLIRMWMREEARKGYQVAVRGVVPVL